jgi:hypothetical protein
MPPKGTNNNPNQCVKCGKKISAERKKDSDYCVLCEEKIKKSLEPIQSEEFEVTNGIFIKIVSDDEKEFLKDVAKDYEDIDFEIPDPNSLLSILFTLRLESKRLSDKLSNIKMDIGARTSIIKSLKDISIEIKNIQKELEITREKLQEKEKSVIEIFKDQMKDAIHYFALNNGHRTGIGICDKCGDRVIFRGNFETFEREFISQLEEIIKYELDNKEPDTFIKEGEEENFNNLKATIKEKYHDLSEQSTNIITRIFYLLELRKLPDMYVVYHRKQIEQALQ